MKTITLQFNAINDVKNFVNTVTRYPYEIDLVSGRYTIDAKSIMGIFSLDLTKPIEAHIHSDSCDDLLGELAPFMQK